MMGSIFCIIIQIVTLAEEIETYGRSLSSQAHKVKLVYAHQFSFAPIFNRIHKEQHKNQNDHPHFFGYLQITLPSNSNNTTSIWSWPLAWSCICSNTLLHTWS